MAEEHPAVRPALGLISLYRQADADLAAWLEKYRDLAVGSKHVQSARRQIQRRLEELETSE